MIKREGWMARARRLAEKWATATATKTKFADLPAEGKLFAGYVVGYRAGRKDRSL